MFLVEGILLQTRGNGYVEHDYREPIEIPFLLQESSISQCRGMGKSHIPCQVIEDFRRLRQKADLSTASSHLNRSAISPSSTEASLHSKNQGISITQEPKKDPPSKPQSNRTRNSKGLLSGKSKISFRPPSIHIKPPNLHRFPSAHDHDAFPLRTSQRTRPALILEPDIPIIRPSDNHLITPHTARTARIGLLLGRSLGRHLGNTVTNIGAKALAPRLVVPSPVVRPGGGGGALLAVLVGGTEAGAAGAEGLHAVGFEGAAGGAVAQVVAEAAAVETVHEGFEGRDAGGDDGEGDGALGADGGGYGGEGLVGGGAGDVQVVEAGDGGADDAVGWGWWL